MVRLHVIAAFAAAAVALAASDVASASHVRRLDVDDSDVDVDADFDDSVDDDDSASWTGSASYEGQETEELEVPKYGQCGGIGYEGSEVCAPGYVCVQSDPWFAQCLPRGSATSASTKKRGHLSKQHTADDDAELLLDDIADDVDVVPAWEQCGGKGFDFDFSRDDSLPDEETPKKECEEGYTCEIVNEWYYQCQPLPDLTGLKLWDQCGGVDYRGSTECANGAICKYFNAWYSQCVPKEQEFS
ncbi:cellulose binding domain-containing protein [Phytophthora sojae]|uniref:Cellulose binding domain-containing protein n=1 Tax=Phytophthora sojae (strain P6497) TaxID=1094619 RepID=G5A981_PHYSP|nr:cellulose binding domain-containing protein [Phytophthora sojae]EGZ08457.1 cellulose binding domain-containing protein [Phytophthora sojae]|eukprot:XP_009536629.1 cellulose binding domain-containing protein [Phytophthora sojae]